MSSEPNFNSHLEFLNNFLAEEADDDKMFFEILEQQHKLLQSVESSSTTPHKTHKRRVITRDREAANARLFEDYFSENLRWPSDVFRRRFRMRRDLFVRIVNALEAHDEYFRLREDASGRVGLSPLQKCTVAIRQLAYGGPADHYDEYLRVAETTAVNCLFNFCRCVIDVFGERYLRRPNVDDCQRLIHMHEERHGFPGMLGSLDCMHWEWKNCPVAWKGQFTRGDHGSPTLMLEAVASADLWIWHAFFGVVGSNNDVNVLYQSPLFNEVIAGKAPKINFTVNGRHYTRGYYLTDGIYPEWSAFVKSFNSSYDPKKLLFKQMQESARKDVERAFGVLQARWAMIRGPARFWYRSNLKDIMYTCIILHNMIIEDEGNASTEWSETEESTNNENNLATPGAPSDFAAQVRIETELRDKKQHHKLRADLIEHIWAKYGNNNDNN